MLTRLTLGLSIVMAIAMLDVKGSREQTKHVASAERPVVIGAAGDIACHPHSEHLAGGSGSGTRCRQEDVSDLLLQSDLDAVLMLGDAQYQRARMRNFMDSYDSSWGRALEITRAVPGNHDYIPATGKATGFFRYFKGHAGPWGRGFYSFDLGSWHVIGLNSNCRFLLDAFGCGKHSLQDRWLKQDLRENEARCTLAFWHRPRFTSVTEEGDPPHPHSSFWKRLYRAGADVILNAHIHHYERFAPQDPHGRLDRRFGIRQWTVGTGGSGCCVVKPDREKLQRSRSRALGFLRLKLHPGRYEWRFMSIKDHPREGFEDSGEGRCHGRPHRYRSRTL